jgi:glycogen operon protein
MLCGKHAKNATVKDDNIYVAMNMYWESLPIELPTQSPGMRWHVFANTGAPSPQDIWEPSGGPALSDQQHIIMGGRSVVILVGRNSPAETDGRKPKKGRGN